ncbi:MAG: divergent polysaccharide deacetylase family protein [Alphaproteobacteria bacterium]|nr:divergent polysaccharide deacetylase family protein [Alphaproteobacteria bacterium]
MNDKNTDQYSRFSGVAILPWMVVLVLILVLVGSVAMLGRGLTTDQVVVSELAPVTEKAPEMVKMPLSETAKSEPVLDGGGKPHIDVNQGAAQMELPSDPLVEQTKISVEVPHSARSTHKLEGNHIETLSETQATAPVPEPKPKTATEEASAAPVPPPMPVSPATVSSAPRSSGNILPPASSHKRIDSSPQGPLPRFVLDGREPWKVYARPHNNRDERPRVAIILDGLGLSSAATEAAIQGLPGQVTLAYQPFSDNIQQWIQLSRAAGHEVLLNLPMELVNYPENDTGPRASSVTLSSEENQDRIRWALSRVFGYVGVVNYMGSRFTTSRDSMQSILAELKVRGLLFVDARSTARSIVTSLATKMEVPHAFNDLFLDNQEMSRPAVDARLAEVESIARASGVAIAIGQAFPVTIERIREWALTLNKKGIALVPISAVVDWQSDR